MSQMKILLSVPPEINISSILIKVNMLPVWPYKIPIYSKFVKLNIFINLSFP